MKKEVKIGVFDSGIGGLTVLHECVKRASHYFYYYGDNANAPYGGKSREEITGLVFHALTKLQGLGIDAAVLACNTATAVCAEEMRSKFPFPLIGMEPAVKPAGEHCKNVLVLATPRTAESERLQTLIAHSPNCRFTVYPAAGLAGAIEKKFISGENLTLSDHLPEGTFDGVVLGCTHYSFLKGEISGFYGAPVFDGNEGTARRLASVLSMGGIGTADHQKTRGLDDGLKKKYKNQVYFVGKSGKINEILYKSERMFL